MTGTQGDGVARGDWQSDHDVSILIGVGAGQEVGWVPSAKVSMMSMRPPQRGQGQGNTRGARQAATWTDRLDCDQMERFCQREPLRSNGGRMLLPCSHWDWHRQMGGEPWVC